VRLSNENAVNGEVRQKWEIARFDFLLPNSRNQQPNQLKRRKKNFYDDFAKLSFVYHASKWRKARFSHFLPLRLRQKALIQRDCNLINQRISSTSPLVIRTVISVRCFNCWADKSAISSDKTLSLKSLFVYELLTALTTTSDGN
jgi:hypothetical protein